MFLINLNQLLLLKLFAQKLRISIYLAELDTAAAVAEGVKRW
jgi:hypothetical protein